MSKVVFLKLEGGDFNQGFKVNLDIAEEGKFPHVIGVRGFLRQAPEIPELYRDWQTKYWNLESNYRRSRLYFIEENPSEQGGDQDSSIQQCYEAAEKLKASFKNWLKCDEFRLIEAELLADLSKADEIRVILQTEDEQLRKLPWEVWDFFQRFSNADLGISPLSASDKHKAFSSHTIKILAILGNSDGIDIQADKQILETLPNAKVCFLVEPTRDQFKKLWEEPWDILFFAGHSSSKEGEKGYIHINRTDEDKLELSELEESLTTAINNGLKLAIFNSCDGLGLARQLEKVHIPQVIVMREPIPDQIAQEFLKYFLTDLARGTSLYTAVRRTRRMLRELLQIDKQFPGASWLPVICQNPGATDFVWPSPPSPWWHFFIEPLKQHGRVAIISGLMGSAIAFSSVWTGFYQLPCPVATEKKEAGVCFKDLQKSSLVIGFLTDPHRAWDLKADYQYFALKNHLKKMLGNQVKNVLIEFSDNLSFQDAQNKFARKEWDIVFPHSPINSWSAKTNGYTWLARKQPFDKPFYRSVLFVRADSPIQSIADIKTTTMVALGHVGSSSSFYVPVYDLYGKSLSVTIGNTHDHIQELVKSGQADVGASTEPVIEHKPEFRIIHRSRPIPVAGVFISPKLSEVDRNQIKQVLLQAPKEIRRQGNYAESEELNYEYIGQLSLKAEEVIRCTDFSKNPVRFFCDKPGS